MKDIATTVCEFFSREERADFSLLAPYILVEIKIKFNFGGRFIQIKEIFYEILLDIGASVLDSRLFVETKLETIYNQMKRFEALGRRHPVLNFF